MLLYEEVFHCVHPLLRILHRAPVIIPPLPYDLERRRVALKIKSKRTWVLKSEDIDLREKFLHLYPANIAI